MRRLFATLLLVLVPLTGRADLVTPSNRVTTHLIVRAQPSGQSAQVGTLQPGERADLLERVPRWYKVRLPSGQEGFVSKSWSAVLPESAPSTSGLAIKQADEMRIHFFNIGTGTCTLVECPGANARPIVVDCGKLSGGQGPNAISDTDLRTRIQSIIGTRAPDVVLSHGDKDHYSLIPHVLQGIRVNAVWQGDDASNYNSELQTWITGQQSQGATIRRAFPAGWHNGGNAISNGLQCGTATAFVLTVNSGSTRNDKSLVLMLEYSDFRVIFTGDATGTTESSAIANFAGNLKTTVLTGSHHGSNTHGSNGTPWASAASPDVIVYSAGTKFGHPRCTVTDRLDDSLATTNWHNAICGTSNSSFRNFTSRRAEYMTRVNGAVTITTNGRSPLQVNCAIGPGCAAQIPF